jgi:hypothetical protein
MTKDEHDAIDETAKLDRRDVLAGGTATVATVASPGVAPAANITSAGEFQIYGAVYMMDPKYLNRFSGHTDPAANFQNVRTKVDQDSKSQARRV